MLVIHLKTYLAFLHDDHYSFFMDVVIKFSRSAFKHGVTEADIRIAFDSVLYDERLDDSDGDKEQGVSYGGFDRRRI
jgi:hypothetical protein